MMQNSAAVKEECQTRVNDIIRQGKQLFDTDRIDDVYPNEEKNQQSGGGLTVEAAARIAQIAAQWRISPLRGQPYAEVLNWATTEAAILNMNIAAAARLLHSALVLRAPLLYPLLMSYIPLVLGELKRMVAEKKKEAIDATTLAVLINVYGRAEVHHDGLYHVFCEAGATVLRDPALSIAHIANVSHALAKAGCRHPGVLATLRDQAVRQRKAATPLMGITILNAYAELDFVDEELFCVYEQHLLERLKDLTPPLLAALLHCLVIAGRGGSSTLLERLGEHVTRNASCFDAFSISKVLAAYFSAGQFSEEAFGALAERACGVAGDFRAEEVAAVLEALSAFDLFDGELFPLLASRLATIIKQSGPVTVEDAATALASFAAVQEPNDELHHWCGKIFAEYADASVLSAEAYINVIWGCMALNIRSDAQKKMVETVRARPELLVPLAKEERKWHKQKKQILSERRGKIAKTYGIALPASVTSSTTSQSDK